MRFVRENRQMANKRCTVRMCCKYYLQILTLKGNICLLEMTIGRLMIALLPVHLCMCNGATAHGESVHEAPSSYHFEPLPNGHGVGRGGHGLSVHRRGSTLLMIAPDCAFFSDRACSKGRRQTVQVQSVWSRSVRCAMRWEVPYSQEL